MPPTSSTSMTAAAQASLGTNSTAASSSAAGHGGAGGGGADDDIDPLDAFMQGINAEVKSQEQKDQEQKEKAEQEEKKRLAAAGKGSASSKHRPTRDDLEEEDNVESYINHMKKQGYEVGTGGTSAGADGDSDEEVYRVAKQADAAAARSDWRSGRLVAGVGDDDEKKDVDPLPPVDHSKITYIPIEKELYTEHDAVAGLTEDRVNALRREFDIHVTGATVPRPCFSFAHFGFDEPLMSIISRQGFSEPTAIQKQAVPAALCGRDVLGMAQTGSGKTAAFIWPMLVHIMEQPELTRAEPGPIGLILAPTRELATQIYNEAKKYGKAYSLKVSSLVGGASKGEQFKELRGGGGSGGVEIVVATPGRLIDMVKMKATNLRRCSFLVIDEADRMFDMGFEPQVRSICDHVRPDRQTLLFSATFPKRVEKLARDVLTDPIRISIGGVGQTNEDVQQDVVILEDETMKWDWLTSRLTGMLRDGSVVIFVGKKAAVDELSANLRAHAAVPCVALHGDMAQSERDAVIKDLRSGRANVLVCTDVAARGLDVKTVRHVVNFDVARDMDAHVHRCGRTGRAGEKGTAHTLVTKADDRFAADLVRNLEGSGRPPPPPLVDVAMRNPRFRSSRERFGSGRGRGG
ncbi:hypothetical protein HK405_010647, partial [Cladochytrium tenue]